MNRTSKNMSPLFATSAAASTAAALIVASVGTWCCAASAAPPPDNGTQVRPQRWAVVKVDLPVSNASFPPGAGADVANSQCLICHSAGMVLHQPPLTQNEWVGEINKMRNAFGALLPADQVEALAKYLQSINDGRHPRDAAADGQGS
jgi:mono/diheme cytochrome c family protein